MSHELSEVLQLLVRWFHVVAGVFWLGQTSLFTFLDARIAVEAGAEGERPIYLVHSGGFYQVEKKLTLSPLPRILHWFKWEAAASVLSGWFLLHLVYYSGGALLDGEVEIGLWLASSIAFSTLIAGWLVYDGLWRSPLARRPAAGAAVSLALLGATTWGLDQLISARAAYIHVGAMLGTIMAANVWSRILPAQRSMVEAVRAGRAPDPALGAGAKLRSKHNTFMALPVIFIMISNHFPVTTYGQRFNWLVLVGYVVAGMGARAWLNARQRRNLEGEGA